MGSTSNEGKKTGHADLFVEQPTVRGPVRAIVRYSSTLMPGRESSSIHFKATQKLEVQLDAGDVTSMNCRSELRRVCRVVDTAELFWSLRSANDRDTSLRLDAGKGAEGSTARGNPPACISTRQAGAARGEPLSNGQTVSMQMQSIAARKPAGAARARAGSLMGPLPHDIAGGRMQSSSPPDPTASSTYNEAILQPATWLALSELNSKGSGLRIQE